MATKKKENTAPTFEGVEIREGEVFTEETSAELSNGKGDDE